MKSLQLFFCNFQFEFHSSDSQEDAPVIVKKTPPPPIKGTPGSVKKMSKSGKKNLEWLNAQKKSE